MGVVSGPARFCQASDEAPKHQTHTDAPTCTCTGLCCPTKQPAHPTHPVPSMTCKTARKASHLRAPVARTHALLIRWTRSKQGALPSLPQPAPSQNHAKRGAHGHVRLTTACVLLRDRLFLDSCTHTGSQPGQKPQHSQQGSKACRAQSGQHPVWCASAPPVHSNRHSRREEHTPHCHTDSSTLGQRIPALQEPASAQQDGRCVAVALSTRHTRPHTLWCTHSPL